MRGLMRRRWSVRKTYESTLQPWHEISKDIGLYGVNGNNHSRIAITEINECTETSLIYSIQNETQYL